MKLISWNVAGYRACLKKGFSEFFEMVDADIFALQEVKAQESQIPYHPEGYYCYLNPAEKLGYSGTLIYTKKKPLSVVYGLPALEHNHEGRVITLEFEKFYFVTVYVPNVKRDLSRMDYRVRWEKDFLQFLKDLEQMKPVIVCGDFNVAHEEIDLKNPKSNIGNAGFTEQERACFTNLLQHGFVDTFRHFYPNVDNAYTWWSYRPLVREKNIGWRIDYFLVSNSLLQNVSNPKIYSTILGSDHCPIGLEVHF